MTIILLPLSQNYKSKINQYKSLETDQVKENLFQQIINNISIMPSQPKQLIITILFWFITLVYSFRWIIDTAYQGATIMYRTWFSQRKIAEGICGFSKVPSRITVVAYHPSPNAPESVKVILLFFDVLESMLPDISASLSIQSECEGEIWQKIQGKVSRTINGVITSEKGMPVENCANIYGGQQSSRYKRESIQKHKGELKMTARGMEVGPPLVIVCSEYPTLCGLNYPHTIGAEIGFCGVDMPIDGLLRVLEQYSTSQQRNGK